ncbi:transcriptional repressor [Legionella impletisoli]|uniref:Transcriptional repressor n=1 Tax=Legionella impletisoli TaxID=343510 RepID=A0A917NE68_9GAMM|nr:transcriptional repressor [Legionella impletisoli]GGI92033.1 transcriptional repressor [Legionella impletisoli]
MMSSASFVQFCSTLGLRLTSLRREVLFILWQAQKPMKAYEVLQQLLKSKPNAKPPSIYRALDFFLSQGIVHKIESIQSFTLCCEPDKQLVSEVLMVCDHCRQVTEMHDQTLQLLVLKLAEAHAFKLRQDVIELKGTCQQCQGKRSNF